MNTKVFKGKKIWIRVPNKKDLSEVSVKKFRRFINSLIEEGAQILFNQTVSLAEEKKWVKEVLENIGKKKRVMLIAEDEKGKIVGIAEIQLCRGRKDHIGELKIGIVKEYRGIGLGSFLVESTIKLAKEKLKPRLKIIDLGVFCTNKAAIGLYKKLGFKEVARSPNKFQYQGRLVDEIEMQLEV